MRHGWRVFRVLCDACGAPRCYLPRGLCPRSVQCGCMLGAAAAATQCHALLAAYMHEIWQIYMTHDKAFDLHAAQA